MLSYRALAWHMKEEVIDKGVESSGWCGGKMELRERGENASTRKHVGMPAVHFRSFDKVVLPEPSATIREEVQYESAEAFALIATARRGPRAHCVSLYRACRHLSRTCSVRYGRWMVVELTRLKQQVKLMSLQDCNVIGKAVGSL